MKTVRKVVHVVGDVIMAFVAVAILVSMVVSTADVVGGNLFNAPLPGAFEGAANLMPVIVFVSLAYIQRRREHVRVEFFYLKGSPRTRALLDIFNAVVVIVFFAFLAWAAWRAFDLSLAMNERSPGIVRFPIYPIKFVVVLGAVMMVLQMLVDLVEYVQNFFNPPEDEPQVAPAGPHQAF
jgi:TRAP-type mannitol/chloroaromatic compound transport system permease small subunit